jgi:TnpA family transposase
VPVSFLSPARRERYSRFTEPPSAEALDTLCQLEPFDHLRISALVGPANVLGYALQLVALRATGRFPDAPSQVPASIQRRLAKALSVAAVADIDSAYSAKTRLRHRNDIVSAYGYRDLRDVECARRFVAWLLRRAWFADLRADRLFDEAVAYLVEERVILPGVTTLERLVARSVHRAEDRAARRIEGALDDRKRERLDDLLLPDEEGIAPLDRLHQRPDRISSTGANHGLDLVEHIEAIGCHALDLSAVPTRRLLRLAQRVAILPRPTLAALQPIPRRAALVAFLHLRHRRAVDDCLDVFDLLLGQLEIEARSAAQAERRRRRDAFPAAALELHEACAFLLDDDIAPAALRERIFDRVPRSRIQAAMHAVEESLWREDDLVLDQLVSKFLTLQRFLPRFLHTLDFQAGPAAHPLLCAITYLRELPENPPPKLRDAPLEGLSQRWRRRVQCPDGSTDRRAFTVWFAHELRSSLRSRDVHAPASQRWDDPLARLIPPEAWPDLRNSAAEQLDLPTSGDVAIRRLSDSLHQRLCQVASRLPQNPHASVIHDPRKPYVKLAPLALQESSPAAKRLQADVARTLPLVDLPGLILEVHRWTGFLDAFHHIGRQRSRSEDLHVSLAAVLLADGCNLPLKVLADPQRPALAPDHLAWIRHCYLRNDTLAEANARLVAAQSKLPISALWGGGEVASVDGLRFVVPVRALHAGFSRKYFGNRPGATWYNYLTDRFAGFHNIVIPGTLRDSLFILDGLLEHDTSASPSELMSDTAGASEIIFALFHLLGFQLSPRLRPFRDQRIWRIDPRADYGPIGDVARHRVTTQPIIDHWDDILRLAASLHAGHVRASQLLRVLGEGSRASGLRNALRQLGRIIKSMHLLHFMDDESYRRRILVQLNRTESRHALARALFFGQRGQLRRGYQDGQEEQLGALGLLLNIVVLWNSRYIDHAITHLNHRGRSTPPELVATLSPLLRGHIRIHGRYHFDLDPALAPNRLRPLRAPSRADSS